MMEFNKVSADRMERVGGIAVKLRDHLAEYTQHDFELAFLVLEAMYTMAMTDPDMPRERAAVSLKHVMRHVGY